MDRSMYLTFVLSLIITAVALCNGQTSDSDQDMEKGVILTVESTNGNTVHLRHLGLNLPYDNFTGRISVPGIRFTDPNILFLSVEVDHREKELFLYDVHLKSIFLGTSYHPKLRVSENNMSFAILHAGVSTGAVQIAYDWLSRTIYWVDSVFKWIVAAPGSFEKLEFDYFKIIVKDGLQHPEGLTVDPLAGYMFFSDNGDNPKIERALLDGSEIMKFDLTKDALKSPESLEVDIFEKRLYIADTEAERILSVDYNGKSFRALRRITYSIFTDVAIYRDTLYAPNIQNGRLYIFNKTDGSIAAGPIGIPNERIYGVAIYKEEVQPLNPNATTNCTKLACDHLCISTATGAKCICSEGFALNTTSNKCYEVEGKFHHAVVLASATEICLLDIRVLSAFSMKYNPTCIYTVQEPATTTSTTTTPIPTTQQPTATLVQSSTAKPMATLVHSSAHTTHITHSPGTTAKTTVPTATPQTSGATTRITTAVPARRKRQVQSTTVAGSTATTTPFSVALKETILRFELDMVERFLFFATFDHEKNVSKIHTRPIDIPINNTERETLVTPFGKVSGLLFDWVDEENLYWSESDTGNIYVFNTKTQSSKRVMAGPVNSPSDLNILAYERKLVWISMNSANNYSIHTVDLNGQNLKNVVVNQTMITSIAIDQDAKLIYWTGNGTVYSIHFNSTDQQPQFVNATNSPDADLLVQYKNYLAWTRPENGGTFLDAYVIDRGTVGNNGMLDPSTSFVDMKILDAQSQSPVAANPCADQNGNCEQICITTRLENGNMTKQCECSLGFVLQSDGLNCKTESVDDDFALVTDWTNDNIFQIDLKTDKINALHFEEQTTYFGVFYNKLTQKVLWSELYSPLVFQSNLDGNNKSEIFDNGGNGQVEKYAVDETTGNIFYTVNAYPTSAKIGVLSPRGEQRYLSLNISFRPTYFFSGIDVHPKKGLLYVTAGSYFFKSYIVKANMDGSNAQLLNITIQKDFSLPEGIAVDHVNDKLYWADYYQDKIYQCDLDGNKCVLFVSQPSEDIKDIATDGEFIYYTAWNSHHLNRVNLMNTSDVREVGSTLALGRLETVSVYRSSMPNTQQPNTACQKRDGRGSCSVFCLPTESGHVCACEEGETVLADGRTCPGVFLCDQKFNQTSTTSAGEIVTVIINDTCLRYVDEVCSFQCPQTYKMKEGQGTLLCNSTGWDRQTDELCEAIYCPTGLANGQWSNCDARAGSTCQYTCNQGYRPIKSSVTCGVDGQWSDNTDTLCSTEICIQSITFGQINSTCSKSNGSMCSYTCNGGYRRTQNAPTSLTCNIDGNWSTDPTSLCEETLCPSTIINGNISPTCTNKIDAVCSYSCVAGSYKPAGLTSLRCLANGNWDSNGQTPCSAICTTSQFKCDTSHDCIELNKVCDRNNDCADESDEKTANCSCPRIIDNGSFQSTCDFRFDSICSYTCDFGYRATLSRLTCQRSSKNWNSASPCEEIFCPATIPNGNISSSCNRTVNSNCGYNCTESFQKSQSVTSLVCQVAGTWNQTAGLCLSQQTVTEGQTSSSAGSSVGIALGVVIAVLVIIALVLVFVMYRRRLGFFKKDSPYSTASFSNSSRENVCIENPGYMTADLRVTNDMDEPYINTALKEEPFSGIPQPVVDHNDIDAGIANPLYFNQEPMASGGEISVPDGDNVVLTTDSWLKEKEKGPDISVNNN